MSTGEFDYVASKEWFEQSELSNVLVSKLSNFTEFVKVNSRSESTVFVVSDHNEDTDASGPAIYCYTNGIPTEFDPPGKPGTPKAHKVTADGADLTWTEPKRGAENVVSYNILYKCDEDEAEVVSSTIEKGIQLRVLSPGREYRVRVQAVSEPGVSVASDSVTIQTEQAVRLANVLVKQSKLVKAGNPATYQLKLRQVSANESDGLYQCEIGTRSSDHFRPTRVLMVVGATGAGKSTLIDGMTNYVLGVKWDDPFRFKVIFEQSPASQAESQTKIITAYTVYSSDLPYDLTIIDTPGFGDTGGIEQDKYIASQIKKFFSESDRGGIDQLHGIGFVAQAPLARLTPTQKYIFHAVLSIFGKDIVDNIFLLITFADANEPPLLDAAKAAEIPYKDHFKFNNSALFASNVSAGAQFNSFFWTMGSSSFGRFFQHFSKAESKSLALTREVLQERAQLETLIPGLQEQVTIQTEQAVRLANVLVKQSKLVKAGNPATYRLKLRQVSANESDGLYQYEIGTRSSDRYRPTRVLMVVGATGAGKSTLIDGMTNYVLGVKWDDPFRYKVTFEVQNQVKAITAYTIYSSDLPYDLTIIDTPGFGDTGGIERDKYIASQIKKFFSESDRGGIDQLHGFGFVAQAPLVRLTPTQKYIFQTVLSLFGKDIVDNILLLITFADAGHPPLLEAAKAANIPYKDHFKFNNSALFASNVSSDAQFNSFFWTVGNSSLENFFQHFSKAESRSLALTREVLQERAQLETLIPDLQEQVKFGLNQLSEIEQEEKVIEQHEADIAENQDFTYTLEVAKYHKIPRASGRTLTCLTCNFTCHESCTLSNDSDKAGCWAMDGNGDCRICPGNCTWRVHANLPYFFEQYTVTETRTYQNLKERYEAAQAGKEKVSATKEKKEEALSQVQVHVYGLIEKIQQSLKHLTEIALKPNPLTEIEYLDLLIQCEESEAKPGYQHRVAQYRKIRKDAEILQKTAKLPVQGDPKDKSWWQYWRK